MSTTPVSNITSPNQSNEVRKISKNIQTLSIFSSTKQLHTNNYIYVQSQVNPRVPRKNKPVQSNEVRRCVKIFRH